MAYTTAEPNDDVEEVNCPVHLIENADAKLNDEDIEEKKDASLNPPVEKAPENDGPVEQDDNASRASEPSPMMNSTSAKPKFRHDHYEKLEKVVIDIFAKSIPAESISVQFSEEILVVRIEIPGEDPYDLNLRLVGKIIPSKSRYSILKTKLEIRLSKAETLYWKSLTSPEEKSVEQIMNTSSAAPKLAHSSDKTRDFWDKLGAEVMEEENKDIMLGKAGVSKALYGDLTEDGRKVMRKSFVLRINYLLDDHLLNILSNLEVRDSVVARSLSHRWRDVWDSKPPSTLEFNWESMLLTEENKQWYWEESKTPCADHRDRFVGAVDQFLKFYKDRNVKLFSIRFCLGGEDSSDINRWIDITANKFRTRCLQLELACDKPCAQRQIRSL